MGWFGHSGQRLIWFDFGNKMYYDGDGGRFQFGGASGCVICGAILQRGWFFFMFCLKGCQYSSKIN